MVCCHTLFLRGMEHKGDGTESTGGGDEIKLVLVLSEGLVIKSSIK